MHQLKIGKQAEYFVALAGDKYISSLGGDKATNYIHNPTNRIRIIRATPKVLTTRALLNLRTYCHGIVSINFVL